jgi:adenylylsulfate kinase-like enzyme
LIYFTGVDDPYEEPLHPEINMKNYEMTVQQSVDVIMKKLREEGVYIWTFDLYTYVSACI